MNKSAERNSSIELLRICAGMAVVILHFNYGSISAVDKTSGPVHYTLLVLEAICICAVDVFIFVSGYFGSSSLQIKPSKLANLLIQTSAFRFGTEVISCILHKKWSWEGLIVSLLPVNYFVILYVGLMLISPYINVLLKKLTASGLLNLLVICVVAFSVYPTLVDVLKEVSGRELEGLSSISLNGSGGGYTVSNFILVYVVGAIARKLNIVEKISLRKWLIIWSISVVVIYLWRIILPGTAYSYSNFMVILEAASIFSIFHKINIQNRAVNILAPASFTCFLLHDKVLVIISKKIDFGLPPLLLLGVLVLLVAGTYLLSFVVMLIWNAVTEPVYKLTIDRIPVIRADEKD